MDKIYGLRKFIIVILAMGMATTLLILGSIDQETFKWLIQVSLVAYLGANVVGKFADQ